jgi:hypothetical protein
MSWLVEKKELLQQLQSSSYTDVIAVYERGAGWRARAVRFGCRNVAIYFASRVRNNGSRQQAVSRCLGSLCTRRVLVSGEWRGWVPAAGDYIQYALPLCKSHANLRGHCLRRCDAISLVVSASAAGKIRYNALALSGVHNEPKSGKVNEGILTTKDKSVAGIRSGHDRSRPD